MPGPVPLRQEYDGSDEYETPKWVLDSVAQYIPKSTPIWEPFVGSGYSTTVWRENGYAVDNGSTCEDESFVEDDDVPNSFFRQAKPPSSQHILISNPPFSKKEAVFEFLHQVVKPKAYALLLPTGTIDTQYFAKQTAGCRIQLMTLPRRIAFRHPRQKVTGRAPFSCNWIFVYLDRDMPLFLPQDILLPPLDAFPDPAKGTPNISDVLSVTKKAKKVRKLKKKKKKKKKKARAVPTQDISRYFIVRLPLIPLPLPNTP